MDSHLILKITVDIKSKVVYCLIAAMIAERSYEDERFIGQGKKAEKRGHT